MREHVWELQSRDDPASMKVQTGYGCRHCGSRASATVDFGGSVMTTVNAVDEARKKVMRRLSEDHPHDCDEARDLNVCRRTHES